MCASLVKKNWIQVATHQVCCIILSRAVAYNCEVVSECNIKASEKSVCLVMSQDRDSQIYTVDKPSQSRNVSPCAWGWVTILAWKTWQGPLKRSHDFSCQKISRFLSISEQGWDPTLLQNHCVSITRTQCYGSYLWELEKKPGGG